MIVNTVAQAQSLVKKLREQLPEYDVMLAHARYTMADRMKREGELLRRLGKKSKAECRKAAPSHFFLYISRERSARLPLPQA